MKLNFAFWWFLVLTCFAFVSVCTAQVADPGDLEECSTPDLEISGSVADDTIEVDGFEFSDLKIDIDIEVVSTGNLLVTLASPEGTILVLHNESRAVFSEDLVLTYSQYGRTHEAPFECGCIMKIDPENALSDLVGESAEGDWVLEPSLVSGAGTLRQWCLRFYKDEPALPVEDLECTSTPGEVELTWSNPIEFDAVNVYVNGELEETLDGDVERAREPSRLRVRLHHEDRPGKCAVRSRW